MNKSHWHRHIWRKPTSDPVHMIQPLSILFYFEPAEFFCPGINDRMFGNLTNEPWFNQTRLKVNPSQQELPSPDVWKKKGTCASPQLLPCQERHA